MVGQHDEGREVLVHAAQSVAYPSSSAGKSRAVEACGLEQRALGMHTSFADHVVHKGDLINDVPQRRHGLAQHLPALPIRLEIPNRSQPRPETILERLHLFPKVARLAVAFDEFRFVVKQVNMAGGPGHEKLDHPLGARFDMRGEGFGLACEKRSEGEAGEGLENGAAGHGFKQEETEVTEDLEGTLGGVGLAVGPGKHHAMDTVCEFEFVEINEQSEGDIQQLHVAH